MWSDRTTRSTAVANAIRRARAGLQDPNRPLGSFIFLGPTGVGKTELARALAEFLFDDEQAMVRIDMSEYQEKHTVSRLIGAPPGYVGYEEAGQLTEAVRRRPYAVVLFDEIEKAHPEVLNVMLQLLDDGRLTDGQGRTVDFRNGVIIMTSNVGSHFIAERAMLGDTTLDEDTRRQLLDALRQHFKPEFLNRIDDVIFFHALGRADIRTDHRYSARALLRRLEDRKIRLELTDKARDILIEEGYDPVYGARPLKRMIQRRLLDPLALGVLQGQFGEGDVVTAEASKDGLMLTRAVAARKRGTMTPTDQDKRPGGPRRPTMPGGRSFSPLWLAAGLLLLMVLANGVRAIVGPGEELQVLAVQVADRRGAHLRCRHHARSDRRHVPERVQGDRAVLHRPGGRIRSCSSCWSQERPYQARVESRWVAELLSWVLPVALIVARVAVFLPAHERHGGRHHVVRPQPREDFRGRRRQGEFRGCGGGRRSGAGTARDRRLSEDTRRNTRRWAAASRRACCSSGLPAPARRCWRGPSPAKPRSPSSA